MGSQIKKGVVERRKWTTDRDVTETVEEMVASIVKSILTLKKQRETNREKVVQGKIFPLTVHKVFYMRMSSSHRIQSYLPSCRKDKRYRNSLKIRVLPTRSMSKPYSGHHCIDVPRPYRSPDLSAGLLCVRRENCSDGSSVPSTLLGHFRSNNKDSIGYYRSKRDF